MHRIAAVAALALTAQAPAPYDLVCPAPCRAGDGTTQPLGTVLGRALWLPGTPFAPVDAAGGALTLTPTGSPPAAIYTPAPPAAQQSADLLVATSSGSLAIKHPDGSLSDSGVIVPTPISTVPPAATVAGNAGSTHTYAPADATPPSLTRSARVTTAADGTFAVTWAMPLISATPVAPNPAPINTGSQPVQCNYSSVTSSGLAGRCWVGQTTALTAAIVTAGLTINPNSTSGVAGISVSVFAREPTQ